MLPMIGFGQNIDVELEEEEIIMITGEDMRKMLQKSSIIKNKIAKLEAELDSVNSFIYTESMPTLAACQDKTYTDYTCTDYEIIKFITRNFKYPKIAKENGIEGRVIVEFFVEKCGHVDRVKILKGLSAEIDKEAIKVIRLLPIFQPGLKNGEPVPVRFTMPINCSLG